MGKMGALTKILVGNLEDGEDLRKATAHVKKHPDTDVAEATRALSDDDVARIVYINNREWRYFVGLFAGLVIGGKIPQEALAIALRRMAGL